MEAKKGLIHSIESFGSVDGPGVRYIIFLQGCRMRCAYCHNPDTWALESKDAYLESADVTLEKALRYKSYWKQNGGITVSGGEAMLQPEYVTELFRLAKKEGVHTTLDTSANPWTREGEQFSKFKDLIDVTDLVMLDIKHINPEKHKALTSWDNSNIKDFANYLSENGKKMWIRHVLVPGYTDDEADLKELSAFIKTLKTVDRVEVLPYHTLGVFKWNDLKIPYTLEGVNPPSKEEQDRANEILETSLYTGYLEN